MTQRSNCNHMAVLEGLSGVRVCQRRQDHDGPHAYLVESDEYPMMPWDEFKELDEGERWGMHVRMRDSEGIGPCDRYEASAGGTDLCERCAEPAWMHGLEA